MALEDAVDRVTNTNTTTILKYLFLILSCSIFLLRSYEQGAAWHPSTPQSSVASVLKDASLLLGVKGYNAAPYC
jgi:hypothetical protein